MDRQLPLLLSQTVQVENMIAENAVKRSRWQQSRRQISY